MARILISWNAANNDFIKEGNRIVGIRENGTHSEFYQHIEDYDKHYILNTASSFDLAKTPYTDLLIHLRSFDKWEVDMIYMDIKDVISVADIHTKIADFMFEQREHEIEVFISPGTATMQAVWYLMALEFRFNAKFFQVRPPWERKGEKYKREYIEVEVDNLKQNLNILETNKRNKQMPKHLFRCDSNEVVFKKATQAANSNNITVLLTGESGTGKEVIANFIHNQSIRSEHNTKMLSINCAAFSDELLESRLFGHKKGSFTTAINDQKGAFETANGSTIFLDEIGDISAKMQQTLLRVLENSTFHPIGSYDEIRTDVRVIAATNKNLWEEVEVGNFRMDLFYRLAVLDIHIPSLVSFSKKDKKKFIERLAKERAKEFGVPPLEITKETWVLLHDYRFYGNVRELINLLDYWYATEVKTLTPDIFKARMRKSKVLGSLKLKDMEAKHIQLVLDLFANATKKKVCEVLEIHNDTLDNRIKEYGLRVHYK